MWQRFILAVLSCSLRIYPEKISSQNLVLPNKSRPSLVKHELKFEENKGRTVKHRHFTRIGTGALIKKRRKSRSKSYLNRQRPGKKIKNRKRKCGKIKVKGGSKPERSGKRLGWRKKRTGKPRTTAEKPMSGNVKEKVRIGNTKGKGNQNKKKQRRKRKPKRRLSNKVRHRKSEQIKCKMLKPNMKRERTRRAWPWMSKGFQKQMQLSGNYQQPGSWSGNYRRPSSSRNYQQPGSWSGNYQQPGSWSGNYQQPMLSQSYHKPWQRPTWQRPTWQRPTWQKPTGQRPTWGRLSLPTQVPITQPTQPQGGGMDSDNNRQVVLLTVLSCRFVDCSQFYS